MTDLSKERIEQHLHTGGLSVEVYSCIPSTNRLAKECGDNGAEEGLVILADSQTMGRGRLGRTFCSPPETGLYMSVLLRPTLSAEDLLCITTAAAVAVCRALERVAGIEARIKWVNDVYCRDKKVCGILTEAAFDDNGVSYVVLGIGINVRTPKGGFPEAIASLAASVYGDEGGDRSVLAAAVLDAFFEEYHHLPSGRYTEEYRKRSMLIGRHVTVHLPQGDRGAVVLGIDEACRLQVRFDSGEEACLSTGDVSVHL